MTHHTLWRIEREGYTYTKVLGDALCLSGGGGRALCRLCKVPRTEDRPSQLHHHLPQWWVIHRSTGWELFLTQRWTLFCLSSGLQTLMQLWWRRISHGKAWMCGMRHIRQWTGGRQRRSTVTSHPRWVRAAGIYLESHTEACTSRKTDANQTHMWVWNNQ